MTQLRKTIFRVVAEDRPMTVRQVFYRLVSLGAVAKTENEYTATVGRLLKEMRLDGELPFGWIADNTRWMRKPTTYDDLKAALRRTAEAYRRSLWDTQGAYVEVWLEKDALAGVLFEITSEFDVPLMVTRGYPSLSFLHSAAEELDAQGKESFIYYLGDRDPSGVDIPRNVEERLREFAPDADLTFEVIAVTDHQVDAWELPTRPTKRTDTRARKFGDRESVELDAVPAPVLRDLVRAYIEGHIDEHELAVVRAAEASEREILGRIGRSRRRDRRGRPQRWEVA
jgi:hypothetical protein